MQGLSAGILGGIYEVRSSLAGSRKLYIACAGTNRYAIGVGAILRVAEDEEPLHTGTDVPNGWFTWRTDDMLLYTSGVHDGHAY